MHGIQTWVALPRSHETAEPAFSHHPMAALPAVELPGARIRVIAGHAFGQRSPVPVVSDTLYAAVELDAGGEFTLHPEHAERAVYLADGEASVAGQALARTWPCFRRAKR